eukprot:TRINITY_DN14857_c0_g2_i2.p1 TRINITY_DN14857_c0_g2~~TRINITY_DN14857_c0_g2_i2.p1  ORF type:complete len:1471 (+),score=365.86 TRINITY_DN14857_c0_g2_i2:56-4468(+)
MTAASDSGAVLFGDFEPPETQAFQPPDACNFSALGDAPLMVKQEELEQDDGMDVEPTPGVLSEDGCTSASLGESATQRTLAPFLAATAAAAASAAAMQNEGSEAQAAPAARARPKVRSKDLRSMFASGPTTAAAARPSPPLQIVGEEVAVPASQRHDSVSATPRGTGILAAFGLRASGWQDDLRTDILAPADGDIEGRLEQFVLSSQVQVNEMGEAVPLLVASAPLLASGQRIFAQLPAQWVDLSGRSDSLGTRCLFASRRHEHSVFEMLAPERLLQVPAAACAWQPAMKLPDNVQEHVPLADEEPWIVQCHPARNVVRVLLRPGVLLMRMLRRGTALPSARFTWRIVDASENSAPESALVGGIVSSGVGEFSILSNVEDAAHTQPPHFLQFPLRREQLRSLGWMVRQERNRKEPFVTELREVGACMDAPHWHMEGSLRCEYEDVRGGVLADAIGYGKTACTIGLVSCSAKDPVPRVPQIFEGMLPSRATLVLAPTNLHAQWLAEITKFVGNNLKVLSIPTCAQLKRLTPQEIMDADIVVATYRLFYSAPYLHRLEELARTRNAGFAFPKSRDRGSASSEWARAYRRAFECLPFWVAAHHTVGKGPITPERLEKHRAGTSADETPPNAAAPAAGGRRRRCKGADPTQDVEVAASPGSEAKRRRITGKRSSIGESQSPSASQKSQAVQEDAGADSGRSGKRAGSAGQASASGWLGSPQYVPLEAFWWRRVVCDEFHELLSRYPPAQVAVELFRADYKWGLSGTPPCQTLTQIRKAAGFFGVQIPTARTTAASGAAAAVGDGDAGEAEVPRRVAQEWLDAFVRRNTSELPPLDEEEKIIPVRLTAPERALYDAIAEQQQRRGSAGAPEAASCACNLLKLCSHFCSTGSSAAAAETAADEVERQVTLRRERLQASTKSARGLADRAAATVELVRYFEPHFCSAPKAADYPGIVGEPRALVASRLKFALAATGAAHEGGKLTGTKAELLTRLFETLSDPLVTEAAKDAALRADFVARDAKALKTALASTSSAVVPTWASLLARANGSGERSLILEEVRDASTRALAATAQQQQHQRSRCPQRCSRLRTSLGMPRAPAASSAQEEDWATFEKEDWTWRADRGCAEQLRSALASWKAEIEDCAAQLVIKGDEAATRQGDYQSFVDTIEASQAATLEREEADTKSSELELAPVPIAAPSRFARYGSKIERLVNHVHRIRAEDRDCKIICFVQWEDLKRKIGAALEEFGVEHLTLQGSVWARRNALMRFQYENDSPKMLLLSLQESASGTNLTAANHVIIVHPMEAATAEEAVAFEMQAIGRVRRPGQQRKIHVWRFVTIDTIEQEITEEHQRELWERQSARILIPQEDEDAARSALLAADSDGEDGEAPGGGGEVAAPMVVDDATQAYVPAAAPAVPAKALMPPPPLPAKKGPRAPMTSPRLLDRRPSSRRSSTCPAATSRRTGSLASRRHRRRRTS